MRMRAYHAAHPRCSILGKTSSDRRVFVTLLQHGHSSSTRHGIKSYHLGTTFRKLKGPIITSDRLIARRQSRYFVRRASNSSTAFTNASRPLILTFDAFGTLFEPKTPVEQQYASVAAAYGLDLDPASILKSFKSAFKALSASYPNYGRASNMKPDTWWAHIIYNTLRPLAPDHTPIPRDLVFELYDRFSTSVGYHLFEDVHPFLTILGDPRNAARWAPQKTMLGIISNSDPRVRSILSSFNVPILPSLFPPRYPPRSIGSSPRFGPATFGFATLSYECGFEKPALEIYEHAVQDSTIMIRKMADIARLTRTGTRLLSYDVRKEFHFMHVGDDLEKDVIAAINCGWDGVLLDRSADQELSERTVDIGGEVGTITFPVINNLLALNRLASRERLQYEDQSPRQKPVCFDQAKLLQSDVKGRTKMRLRKTSSAGRRFVQHPASTEQDPLLMLE